MNDFSQSMTWVELEHSFPEDLAHFHARRFQALAKRAELFGGLPRIVVVAGSCGKASTARFLACMLQAAGLRVGLGTKPPLSESQDGHRERYQLFDEEGEHWITRELFGEIVSQLRPHVEDLPPELGPLAPYDLRAWILLDAFKRWGVDIGIVEANIGLRYDPAGALPAALTVLTPIATDHAQMLQAPPEWSHLGAAAGPLWHKLSACPSGQVVVGRQPSISAENLDRLLARSGPRFGRDFFLDQQRSGLWGSQGRFRYREQTLQLRLDCLGEFQLDNAATAAVAYLELCGSRRVDAVLVGARRNQIPGRLQVLGRQPLELLCVASSRPKVQAMLDSLEPLFDGPRGRMVIVMSLLDRVHAKEEVAAYVAAHPRLRALVTTQCEYPDDSRDLPAEQLAHIAGRALPGLEVWAEPDPAQAIQRAREKLKEGDLLLLLGNGLAAHQAQLVQS